MIINSTFAPKSTNHKYGKTMKELMSHGARHGVINDVEGRFVVEKAFKTKRNHFAMRLKNLQTGETKTVYGYDEDEVSFKAKRVFGTWIVSSY